MKSLKKMWTYIRISFRYCFFGIAFFAFILLFNSFVRLLFDFTSKYLTNQITDSIGVGFNKYIWFSLAFFLVAFALTRLSGHLYQIGFDYFRIKLEQLFRRVFLYRAYNTEHDKFFDADYMNRYTFADRNVTKVVDFVGNIIQLFFSSFADFFAIVAVFAAFKPILLLFILFLFIIHLFISVYSAKKRYSLSEKQLQLQRETNYYEELLSKPLYAKEIRIYDNGEHLVGEWKKRYSEVVKDNIHLNNRLCNLNNAQKIINHICVSAIAIGLLLSIYRGEIDIGTFTMLFSMVNRCNTVVEQMVKRITGITYQNYKYIENFAEFVLPPPKEEILESGNTVYFEKSADFGQFNTLNANGLTYRYPNAQKNALENVSFNIKKGEIVCILGYNGSGKSTLINLALGLSHPQKGVIFINGNDMNEEPHDKVSRYYGVAFQDFARFSLSLKENVTIGCVEKVPTDFDLEQAFDKGGLQTVISRLPQKDDTIIGKQYDDNGIELSGGEWQRIALARAYYGDPEIVVLDEPTASIDPLQELRILENIRRYLDGKTAILVSHRIGLSRLADRILFMKNGEIVEEGTPDELLKANGEYANMFNAQKELYN